jgi:hypothetical protein
VLRALTNRTLLANTWAFFVFGYFLFFFMTWLPSYLERAYGLNLRTVGVHGAALARRRSCCG